MVYWKIAFEWSRVPVGELPYKSDGGARRTF